MYGINSFSSSPLSPTFHAFTLIQPCIHSRTYTGVCMHQPHSNTHTSTPSSLNLSIHAPICIWPSALTHTSHINFTLFPLLYILLHFLLHPPFAPPFPSPFPSPLLQSPSIWASESGRAPDPPMRLGCEGSEPSRPGRGGASAARGGAGLRLPGPPGRDFPPVLHPRSSRRPGGLRGRGLPAAQRAGPEQRCEVQASVGGTVSLQRHCHQSVQGAGALRATGGGAE